MRALAKLATGLTVSLGLAATAQSAEAQPPKLSGTFTGLVTSGEEVVFPFFSAPEITPLAGRTFILDADIDIADNDDFDSMRMYLAGGGGQSFIGVEEPVQAGLTSSYANGVLRVAVNGGASGNDSGTAVLLADVVNRQLVNWRGSVTINGQTGIGYLWRMQATMPNLSFTGTYAGPIPEPATWAMMIAGFGLAGATLRRTRSQPFAA